MKIVRFAGMRSEEFWPLTAGGAASNPISGEKIISALNAPGCSALQREFVDALIFTASNYRFECRAPEGDLARILQVLFESGKTYYKLDDQKKPEAFAGQKVQVTGTLNKSTKTTHLTDIKAVS